jgi:hypothetical protein
LKKAGELEIFADGAPTRRALVGKPVVRSCNFANWETNLDTWEVRAL